MQNTATTPTVLAKPGDLTPETPALSLPKHLPLPADLIVSMLEARRDHLLADRDLVEALASRVPVEFTTSEVAGIIAHARKTHARAVETLGDEAASIESCVEDAAAELIAMGDFR